LNLFSFRSVILGEINGTLPKLNCMPLENVLLKREVATLKREKAALKLERDQCKIEMEQWQDLAKKSIEAQEAGYQASSSSSSGNRDSSSKFWKSSAAKPSNPPLEKTSPSKPFEQKERSIKSPSSSSSSSAGNIPSKTTSAKKWFDRGASKPQQQESEDYKANKGSRGRGSNRGRGGDRGRGGNGRGRGGRDNIKSFDDDEVKKPVKPKEPQEDPEEASRRLIEQMLAEEAEENSALTNRLKQEHLQRLQQEEVERKKRSDDDHKLAKELQEQWKSFECSICMEDKSLDDVFYTDECDHQFCRKWYVIDLIHSNAFHSQQLPRLYDTELFASISDYVNSRILHLEFPIPCPGCTYANEKEPAEIGQDLVQIVVDAKDYQNYLDKTLQKHAMTEGLFTCPQPNCKGLAEIVAPNRQFMCPVCHFTFCTVCLIPWHSNVTCEAYQAWKKDNDNADELTNAALRALKVLPCPACRHGVYKTEGCNKMTCRCGTLFCYRCAARLDSADPYRHFNITACKLFDDSEL